MRKAARAIVVHNQNVLVMKRNKFGTVYYTLPGGGIDMGETADQAAVREIKEESGLTVANPKLVYIEEAGEPYGTQYIFVCDYQDGDLKMSESSIETQLNKMGKNLFEIMWVPISKFAGLQFRSTVLQKELLDGFRDGWPSEPKQVQSQAEISYNKMEEEE